MHGAPGGPMGGNGGMTGGSMGGTSGAPFGGSPTGNTTVPLLDGWMEEMANQQEEQSPTVSSEQLASAKKIVDTIAKSDTKLESDWAKLEPKLQDGISKAEMKKLMALGKKVQDAAAKAEHVSETFDDAAAELDEDANADLFALIQKASDKSTALGTLLEEMSSYVTSAKSGK